MIAFLTWLYEILKLYFKVSDMSKNIFAYKLNNEPRNGLSGCKLKTPDIKNKQHKIKDFYIGAASLTLRQKLRQKNESLLVKEMLCKE